MALVYVPSSTDETIQETPNGGTSINRNRGVGCKLGNHGYQSRITCRHHWPGWLSYPVKMTMNGILIDETDVKVLSNLKRLSKYSYGEIHKAFKIYIEGTENSPTGEPREILHKLQAIHIQVQNKMFTTLPTIHVSKIRYKNLFLKWFITMLKRYLWRCQSS